ncbi:redox-sensitive bicupin YhaK (pirin superfamily) [Agromyces sp. 3263]|uniref:pirin family protein n=1 Tax=Agromyces sp. 3263 TaxID=2817750 RepID=UPI00285EC71C|nr:pirin family protein [Agromyces sp. 3263]MDR6906619.1 redox-sensitive bicupin YhaK (pirin superfamily) [Agromyces sp. 3263]
MSNLERDPVELLCPPDAPTGPVVQVLAPRDVPLGGPRAMRVRRTLPQRGRTTIGAWCFADHYGPDDVAESGGMVVPPHPHTGLQTVSWLFEGEIEHRDSAGSHELVRPGAVNLMTAGRGISHSEVSTPGTTRLHGVQLWVALPEASRRIGPFFEHAETVPVAVGDAIVRVFVGALAGVDSDVTVFSPLLGAQVDLPAHGRTELELDPAFEHGVLVDAGPVAIEIDGAGATTEVAWSELAYVEPGRRRLVLAAGAEPVRVVLLGGVPFGEELVMWWNFIGRSHDEVVEFRREWQADVIGRDNPDGRFGVVDGFDGDPLPAPELPTVRLKPRR